MINFELLSRPKSVAILAAGSIALAGCSSSRSPENPLPEKSDSSDPELAATPAVEKTQPAVTEASPGSGGINICDISGGSFSGAVPALRGQTAKEAVKNWAPYVKEDFGVDEDIFLQAVESGQVEFHQDNPAGPEISGSTKFSQNESVGYKLEC